MASVSIIELQAKPRPPAGLKAIPSLEWGTHVAHFFGSGDELSDVLVPYFKAGLKNNEQCLWVTGQAFDAEQARSALRSVVPDLDQRELRGQIEIVDGSAFYSPDQDLSPDELVDGLLRREEEALALGYAGLRTGGNCAWVSAGQWNDFLDYEELVQVAIRNRRMICLCSYCSDQMHDGPQGEVMERHDVVIPSARRTRRPARSEPELGRSDLRELRETFERHKRTFDLAMTASRMGTWRYTFADNICVYDENAQRLYGLTEAQFLHDEEGVKDKFHPEDLDLMWSRVAAALDPEGDGRYDVEYRVKQLDGSWRWLSAWGLVEFEGEGADRKPVAIAGASRDLTERKEAEQQQRLLLNELSHRVKNTLATIQAISMQTLKSASDLPSAQQTLDQRIVAMARAHDLLTSRSWTAADMREVVERALGAFSPKQIQISGGEVDLSPRQALALTLALHELATNATKYGALSTDEGRVDVQWQTADGRLQFEWQESGGPLVIPPSRKGFGSRLLERLLVRDLGGEILLSYDREGLRFTISAEV